MKESKFGILFRHWIFAHGPELVSASYELKQTTTDSIPFSCLEEHQITASEAIKWGSKGSLIRVESGTIGAPDYIFLRNTPAFIVIKYPNCFTIIDIETFVEEKKRSKRKSLTLERASAIAWKVVNLSNKGQ